MGSATSQKIKKTVRLMKQDLPRVIEQRKRDSQTVSELHRLTKELEPASLNYVLAELLANVIVDHEAEPGEFMDVVSSEVWHWFDPLREPQAS